MAGTPPTAITATVRPAGSTRRSRAPRRRSHSIPPVRPRSTHSSGDCSSACQEMMPMVMAKKTATPRQPTAPFQGSVISLKPEVQAVSGIWPVGRASGMVRSQGDAPAPLSLPSCSSTKQKTLFLDCSKRILKKKRKKIFKKVKPQLLSFCSNPKVREISFAASLCSPRHGKSHCWAQGWLRRQLNHKTPCRVSAQPLGTASGIHSVTPSRAAEKYTRGQKPREGRQGSSR